MNNIWLDIIYLTAIIISVAVLVYFMVKDAKKYSANGKNLSKIDNTIRNILSYLDKNITDDGHLIDVRNLKNQYALDKTTYNPMSHVEMIYALKLCANELGLDDLTNYTQLATKCFIENYIQKIDNTRYVVPLSSKVKLSFVVMTIIGLSYSKDEFVPDEILEGLGDFLFSMQLETGQFYNYYDLESKMFDNSPSNLNFTGDAPLGLLYLYDFDGQQKWLNAAKSGLLFLANKRKNRKEVQFDCSSMLAVEKLLHLPNNTLNNAEILLLKNDLLRMVEKVLSDKKTELKILNIARTVEGLIAAYNCFDDNEEIRIRILKSVDTKIKALRLAQIQNGTLKGGFPNSMDWNRAGVPPSTSLIKADTVCHALIACVKFQNLFKD